MKKIYFLFLLSILTFSISAQCSFTTNITASGPTVACGNVTLTPGSTGNVWTQKSGLPASSRMNAVGFSIGTKGYLGTGNSSITHTIASANLSDFWEYDPSNNTWSQKANFGGGARIGAVGFSIGTKGYIGTGYNGSNYLTDFWEYDPTLNTWTQKANFGGGIRRGAVGFNIGNKGYLGTGFNGSSYLSDFWEYDPSINTWAQKANFGGGSRYIAVGMAIASYSVGYIGTGSNGTYEFNDFWEYNPGINTWTQKPLMGTIPVVAATGFAAGNRAYIATGFEPSNSLVSNKIWEFDPSNNTWTQKTNMGSTNVRLFATGFSIGLKGYIGTGSSSSSVLNSFWEYEAAGTYTWSNGSISQAITATVSGSYSVMITNGSGCTATAVQALSLSPNPSITVAGSSVICIGTTYSLVANGAGSYTWSPNAGGVIGSSIVVTPSSSIVYTVSGSTGTCTMNYLVPLTVNPVPSSLIALSGPTLTCGNVTLTAGATGDIWTQKANFGGAGRQRAVGFSIGSKGYIGTGSSSSSNYSSDFWEYDPSLNAWTQKANFGGPGREGAVGFSIGSKGYIGTGVNYSIAHFNDFWEYDPSSNLWTQKANFGGIGRDGAVGFSIGNKGYLGTGYNGSGYSNDFWEYNPTLNTWTQKANFAGSSRYAAVGMAIASYSLGYIGTGFSGSGVFNDFWEYNPSTNIWTQKSQIGYSPVYGAFGFAAGNSAYITTGYEPSNYATSDKIWEYNPTNNSWIQKTGIGLANNRYKATGFVIGLKAYIGTGADQSPTLDSFWEYEAPGTYSWSTGANSRAITATVSGSYSVFVTNSHGCAATAFQTLSMSPNPTITVTGASVLCAGTANTLTAYGAGSYSWSANAGGVSSNSVVVTPTSSINYTVSGTTGTCTVNYPVTLTVNPVPFNTITASGPTLGCGTIALSTSSVGNTWTQKASLNTGRLGAVAFSIGNKGYIGTGYNGSYLNDFWEYDPTLNTWTQKANVGGSVRTSGVGFSIGPKGYVGTGYSGSNFLNDFWEYDPTLNSWTQKTNFIGGRRVRAIGFNIGVKGYIGTGFGGSYANDFFEFDPSLNTWTQKSTLNAPARDGAIGFSIGTKGYIGAGNDGTYTYNDFWEYNPITNIWTQKTNIGNFLAIRDLATGFSIGNKGYVVAGRAGFNSFLNDLWEYNPGINSWVQRTSIPGSPRCLAAAFVILGKAYVGSGEANGSTYLNDIWQYDPLNTINWSTSSTSQSISVTTSGIYSLTTTNPFGCSATTSQSIALSPNPTITVLSNSLACSGQNNTLIASGATSYSWSTNTGGSNSNSVVVSPTTPITYTVYGTTGSCTVDYPITLNVNPSPTASISVIGSTIGCGNITLNALNSGNTWIQKTSLNLGRQSPVAFGIGNKGYVGLGFNSTSSTTQLGDFWEYDPGTNAWTQKANFGGTARWGAVGFVIGNNAYVGTGYDVLGNYKNDFWEYNPQTNTWIQKANFGGVGRTNASGFAVNNKGYLGTGYGTTTSSPLNDVWEYNPVSNTWSQKANLAGGARYGATGFNIGTKGYFCGGIGGPSIFSDLWEYDPTLNTWTQKANFGGGNRIQAAAFNIGTKGYLVSGTSGGSNQTLFNDLWEYDQINNSWLQKSSFSGIGRSAARGFAINGIGYLCAGAGGTITPDLSDVWQYNPSNSINWSTGSTIQAITASTSGNYSVTITSPTGCSVSASQSLAISPNPTISITTPSLLCSGNTYTLIANGASTYTWSVNTGAGNSASVIITPTSNSNYTVSGTTGSCSIDFPFSINVNPTPITSISVSGPTLGCGTLTLSANGIGNTWTQKASMSIGRQFAVAFSIGNKGYTGTGFSNNTSPYVFNDFWEYDPTNNAWTQKANFAGGQRTQAVGFNIGLKGYVGTGIDNSNNHKNDFWEYDPIANTWTQRANFAGSARYFAIGFGIGTKGYLGTGSGTVSPNTYNDFWEYDPSTNTWTQKANFAGTSRYGAVGFSILNKGYVCTGSNNGTSGTFNDTWEYDATLNSWTQKAAFSGNARFAATAFVISNRAFIGTGLDNTGNYSNDFWEYNQSTNSWIQRLNFGGSTRQAAVAFALSGKGYLGTGYSNASPNYMSDFWEYNPSNFFNWSTGSTLQTLPVSTSGNYSLTVTSAMGCSSSAAQTISLSPNPTISVATPSLLCSGNSYSLVASGANTYSWSSNAGSSNSNLIIVSPTSSVIYTVSGSYTNCSSATQVTLSVYPLPTLSINAPTLSVCPNHTVALSASGAISYTWSGGIFNNTAFTPFTTTTYSVIGASSVGCINSQPVSITVTVNPSPLISINSGTICQGQTFTMSPGGASTYSYSSGTSTVAPLINNTYSVIGTSAFGCVSASAAIASVTVLSSPTVAVSNGSICVGQSFSLSPTGASNYIYSGGSAVVSPGSSSSYTIIGTNANGCSNYIPAVATITVYTLPTISAPSGSICEGSSFTINPSGAISYTFSSGSNIVSPTSNTSYSIFGTNAAGCINTIPALLNVTVNPIPVVTVNSGSICQGQSFTLIPNGASTYTYSNGSAVVSPMSSNNYSVMGTSFAGCVSSAAAIATVDVLSSPTIAVSGGSICSGQSFTLSPTGALTYTYSGGSAIVSPSNNTSYTISGTNANGCSNFIPAVATITVYTLPTLSAPSGSICAGSSFTISPSGALSYTYSSGSNIVTPATTNSYSVYGTNAAGCINTIPAALNVTVNTIPVVTVNSGSICQGQSFTLVPNGASTYTYSNGSAVVSPMSSNNYSVMGTSFAGCVSSSAAIASVNVLSSPTLALSSGSICNGQSFTLSPTGALTYTYSGGSAIVSPSNNTSYTISGTNANGCSNFIPAVATITVYTLPTVSAPSGSICAGSSFTINSSGAISYTYSSGSSVVSPTSNTSYSIFGTNAAGCINNIPAMLNVTVNPIPIITTNSGTICQGQSFTLIPNGASTYTYSSSSSIVSPLFNNTYSVTGTSAFGCLSTAAAVASVNVLNSPTVAVSNGSICTGQSFTLSPSGASTYSYSSGSSVVSPSNNTSYTISGTNANGCSNYIPAIATITVYTLPTISAASGSICIGSAYTISPNGANTYTYSSGSNVVSPLSNTSYSIFGTNAEGCINILPALLNVTVNPIPIITVNSGTICQGQSFTLIPNGASTYTYSGGNAIVTPTTNTSYSVIGTSSAGCISSITAISDVTVYALPIVTASGGTICSGNSFTLVPSGANTYTYSGGNSVVYPNSTTNYSISGTNTLGCISASPAVANVTVYALPILSVNSGSICSGSSFTINAGGASSYTYSSGSNIVTPIANTSYSVVGTNSNGCVAAIAAISQVTVVANPTISIPSSVTICFGDSYTITPIGATNYTYSGGSNVVSPSSITNYSLIGASVQGCTNTAVISVSVQPPITVSIAGSTVTCDGQSVSLTGLGAVTYTWDNGATSNSISVTPSITTIFSVSATDGYCSGNASQTVVVNPNPTLNILSTNSLICASESVTLSVTGANTYTWDNGNNTNAIIVQPTVTTSYSVIGIDQNGCTNSSMIIQSVDACVGVKNTISNYLNSISVYPNPNNGEITIDFENKIEKTTIEIYNYLGQLILKEYCDSSYTQVNFKNAANGLYTLRILSSDKVIYVKKLIKE